MIRKPQIKATLHEHVSDALKEHGTNLGETPSQYLALVANWWYAKGCPPVTEEEARLRAEKAPKVKAPKAS